MFERLLNYAASRLKSVPGGQFGRERFRVIWWAYWLVPMMGLDYPRNHEWEFTLNNLPKPPARVLDVGTNLSLFIHELAARGYDTFGLDFSPFAERLPKKIGFSCGDLTRLPFASEVFDAVTMVSVIEHVGLGSYETSLRIDGDLIAMRELARILRIGGHLILTTLVGNRLVETPNGNQRIYDQTRFEQLIKPFVSVREQYYVFRTRRWFQASKDEAFSCSPERWGLACVTLRKGMQ